MPNTNLPIDEKQIEQLELEFPAVSGVAFANAYQQAIQNGLSVVVSEGESLFEVFPDGQRKLVKTIAPPSPAQIGQKFVIRILNQT